MDRNTAMFVQECEELLSQVEAVALELASGDAVGEGVNHIFRIFHTIKGSGAMFGFQDIARFAHSVEAVLDRVRSGALAWSEDLVELVLAAKDHLDAQLAAAKGGPAVPAEAGEDLVLRLGELAPSGARAHAVRDKQLHRHAIMLRPQEGGWISDAVLTALLADLGARPDCSITLDVAEVPPLDALDPARCFLSWRIDLVSDETPDEVRDHFIFIESEAAVTITSEPFYGALDGGLVLFDELSDDALDAPPPESIAGGPLSVLDVPPPESIAGGPLSLLGALVISEAEPRPASAEQRASASTRPKAPRVAAAVVRVSAEKLDRLVDLVGELVIGRSSLAQSATRLRDARLSASVEQMDRLIVELREGVLGIRMMPIGTTFGRFKRLVHDLSARLGKKIDLVTMGADTELDKSVLDQLVDPLMHLVRNAADHGIEPEATRLARGKPERGTIRLTARHEGQHVVITIEDDGKGLDAAAIREKGIQRGLISAEQAVSNAELYKLIFLPGFSTAREVTDVSGRGVGMDVVKGQLDALRGSVSIVSEPGRGATLSLRLPLTLAIIDGLLVEVAEARYIIPSAVVQETVELPAADRHRHNGRRATVVRDELVPYIALRDLFDAPGVEPAKEPQLLEKVVIVHQEGERVGVVVDRVLGEHQTVIQPLGRFYRSVEVFSGATIMGDGGVALILDVSGIVRMNSARERQREDDSRRIGAAGCSAPARRSTGDTHAGKAPAREERSA